MSKVRDIGPGRFVILAVCAFFCFSALIIYMGYSANKQMEETVTEQFNRQQLILAKKIAINISNHFKFLETSLRHLNQFWEQRIGKTDETMMHAGSISTLLSDWLVLGVVHLEPERKAPVMLSRQGPVSYEELGIDYDHYLQWGAVPENRGKIFIGRLFMPDTGIFEGRWLMIMAAPAWRLTSLQNGDSRYDFEGLSLLIVDPVSIAERHARDVRSGETGYAWVIDLAGVFLTHHEEGFVGEDSFTVRRKRNPGISYARINGIMRKDMIEGKEGTDWYISGWHRGMTDRMKKLFAYSPVVLSSMDGRKNLWSVGVVAPATEVYGIIESLVVRQWVIAGIFQVVVFFGLVAAVYFSLRWSRILQAEVDGKTTDLRRSESEVRSERDKVKESMEQLIRTQEMLIRSERFAAIGEAAAYLSHEIKNPLMLIGGFANQIEKSLPEEDDNIRKLRIIRDETRRLELLLTDVRDFTRPSLPQKELRDIRLSIEETLALVKNELEEKGIGCDKVLDNELPHVWFDPEQIKQVLINLIKNAAEATSEGGITIVTEQNDDCIKVSIIDTGKGMSAETVENIFNPFFTTKKKGTGLGLAVCRKIIEDHVGKISVESREGKGTCITFTLPVNPPLQKGEKDLVELRGIEPLTS